jgi:DNA-binding response OmpR family regulator
MAKILIVEDDPHLSSLIRNLLVAERHTAETAVDGNDALEMLKMFKYDLVVLDWMLPEISRPRGRCSHPHAHFQVLD